MELRNRKLPDTSTEPFYAAAEGNDIDLFNTDAIPRTPRCRSVPNTPVERETNVRGLFPPVPRMETSNFETEARNFAQDRMFTPVQPWEGDRQRQQDHLLLRPTAQHTTRYQPLMHEREGPQPAFRAQSRYDRNYGGHQSSRHHGDYRGAPMYNTAISDFKPRTPIFDGKVDTWEPFIMQLRFMSKTYNWPEWKFHEQLLFSLRGDALMFASNLNPAVREDSTMLLGALEQRFGQSLLAETYRANLYNVRKSSKETLQEYSARVNHLMSRAYPGMEGTSIYSNLLIEHLLKGLPDQRLAYEVLTRKPRDLNEAVDMITWHEACRQYTMKTSGIRNIEQDDYEDEEEYSNYDHELRRIRNRKISQEDNSNHKFIQFERELQNLSRLFHNMMNSDQDSRPRTPNFRRKRELICYNCEKPGHIAPDCPNKKVIKTLPEEEVQENQEN